MIISLTVWYVGHQHLQEKKPASIVGRLKPSREHLGRTTKVESTVKTEKEVVIFVIIDFNNKLESFPFEV